MPMWSIFRTPSGRWRVAYDGIALRETFATFDEAMAWTLNAAEPYFQT